MLCFARFRTRCERKSKQTTATGRPSPGCWAATIRSVYFFTDRPERLKLRALRASRSRSLFPSSPRNRRPGLFKSRTRPRRLESAESDSAELALGRHRRGESSRSTPHLKPLRELYDSPSHRHVFGRNAQFKQKQSHRSSENTPQQHCTPAIYRSSSGSASNQHNQNCFDTQRSSYTLRTIQAKQSPKRTLRTFLEKKLPNGKVVIESEEEAPLLPSKHSKLTSFPTSRQPSRRPSEESIITNPWSPRHNAQAHNQDWLSSLAIGPPALDTPNQNRGPSPPRSPSHHSNMSERPLLQSAPGKVNPRIRPALISTC